MANCGDNPLPEILTIVALFAISCSGLVRAASKCCPVAGCFSDNPPFDGLPLPECVEVIKPTMYVYTRLNAVKGQNITRSYIPPVVNGSRWTVFFVHGWWDGRDNGWFRDLKDAVLRQADCNVIVVGWELGSQHFWYPQSASDTRTVGTEIGLVARNIITRLRSSKSRLYCVGHSLGAHVCGHAGMMTKFGRITGLDPAGPLFETRDWSVGLNPSAADLVDVIHTNGKSITETHLGTMKVLGHVDFYPNGGGRQPDCILDPISKKRMRSRFLRDLGRMSTELSDIDWTWDCSHQRAVWYYLESITSPCFTTRQRCHDQNKLPPSGTPDLQAPF